MRRERRGNGGKGRRFDENVDQLEVFVNIHRKMEGGMVRAQVQPTLSGRPYTLDIHLNIIFLLYRVSVEKCVLGGMGGWFASSGSCRGRMGGGLKYGSRAHRTAPDDTR